MALFIFFPPNQGDVKEYDLPVPDTFYDNVARSDTEMVAHLKRAYSEATAGWSIDDVKARLVMFKLDGHPDDELQVVYLTQRLHQMELENG